MTTKISIPICFCSFLLFAASCNHKPRQPNPQQQNLQQQARQQAIQDSMARARAQEEQGVTTERNHKRTSGEDSAANASTAPADTSSDFSSLFSPNGDYALQVSSWRSQKRAQEELNKWKKRGYSQAYLMKYGKEETGNIWYRVRLGHFKSHADGEQVSRKVNQEYNVHSWVSYVK